MIQNEVSRAERMHAKESALTMWLWSLIPILALGAMTLAVGCGKKGKGGGSPAPTSQVPSNCAAGTVWHSGYGCIPSAGCPTGYGKDPTTQQCIPGSVPLNSVTLHEGHISGIDNKNFRQILRDLRMCDLENLSVGISPNWFNIQYYAGPDCNQYSQAFLSLYTYGTTAPANAAAEIWVAGYGGWFKLPPLYGQVLPIDSNAGFALKVQGWFNTEAFRNSFLFSGTPNDFSQSSLAITIKYKNGNVGRVTTTKRL